MRILRQLFLLILLLVSPLVLANDEALSRMYDLTNQSVPERSEEKHLTNIDNILAQAPNDPHLSALAKVLKAHYYIFQEDFAQSRQFLSEAKPLVEQIEAKKLTNEYKLAEIFLLRSNGDIDEALSIGEELYKEVIESWPKHKLSNLVLEISYLKIFKYQHDQSLDLLQVALDYSLESEDVYQIAETYNLFGIVYSEMNDTVAANSYFQRAIKTLEENPSLEINTYIYSNLADSYRLLKDYPKANEYLDKSEQIAKEEDDVAAVAFTYQIRSRLLVDQKKYEEALTYLLQAKEVAEEIGEKLFNYGLHSELSYVYLKLNQLDKAEEHLLLAESNSSNQAETDKYFMESIRARILKEQGRFKEAFESLDASYKNYREKFNEDFTQASNLAREQLDTAQLNFDNQLLAKENELNAKSLAENRRFTIILRSLVIALIVLMFVLLWLIFRFRRLAINNKRLALTDNLTRLPNRRHIFRELDSYQSKSAKGGFGYSVILFDLDHFKAINDQHGHQVGDKVIQATRDICQEILRKTDTLGRIGGEEFLLILPNTKLEEACQIAERIRQQFENYDFETLANGLKVTSSFGVTEYNSADSSLDFVINRADRLLYKAKHEGRNRVFANSV